MYTNSELIKLSSVIDRVIGFDEGFHLNALEASREEKSTGYDIVRELIGSYVCGFTWDKSAIISDFLKTSKKEMSCFLCSNLIYERILALWRIEIDK